jgi:hypothetical protein
VLLRHQLTERQIAILQAGGLLNRARRADLSTAAAPA